MRPAEARHRPMMVRRHVVFPAPLRPSSMVSPPRGTAKSTPCRMWYWPMWVLTPDSASMGGTSAMRGLRISRSNPQVCFLHDGRGDDRGRVAVGRQPPLVQHDDAVGQRAHHVHLVLH